MKGAIMAKQPPKTVNIRADQVIVEIPWQESQAFRFTHVELELNLRQGKTLRFIRDALEQRGAKLADGSYVTTQHSAVKYLIESAATEIGVDVTGKIVPR